MRSQRTRTSQRQGARPWASGLAAVCGAAFGLGLARTLFEWQPLRLAALGDWPGTLLLAAIAAAMAAALAARWPGHNAAHFLPLALPLLHALSPNVDLLRGWVLASGALALTILLAALPSTTRTQTTTQRPPARARAIPDALLSVCLFLFLFFLYLHTLAPAVGEADTFEFQVGIARLGIAHGSGYPLLMLVGKVFSLLPLGGTLAWRANLTSAVFGGLAAVLVIRLARKLGAGPLPALLAGLLFGVSPTLWSRAVEVEAYTLNAALVAAILYLSIHLVSVPPATDAKLPAPLTLLAFLFGLSLTNHLTTLLLAPTCVLASFIFIVKERRLPEIVKQRGLSSVVRRLSSICLAFLLGLSLYLYLPLRWPAVNNGERLSFAQFANIVTGNEAKGAFQWDLPLRDPGRFAIVFDKLQNEYGWPGLVAVVLGVGVLGYAAWQWRRGQPTGWATGLLLLLLPYGAFVYFGLAFNVPDPDFSAFFIPLHLITAVLLGLVLQVTLSLLTRLPNYQLPITAAQYGLLTIVSLLPLRSLWQTLPRVDQSGDWERYQLGEHILRQPLAQGATILADSQKIAPLYYLQVAEGVRPDLEIVVLPDEASYRAALDERLAAGRTVYLARYLPGLGGGYSLRSVGPLAEVSPTPWTTAPLALSPPLQPINAPGTQLLGYASQDGATLNAAAPGSLPVTLAWKVDVPLNENLLVSLQLVDVQGRVAWRSPGSVPVNGLYPTNAWRLGEVITDYHAIPIDHSLPPGFYRLQVRLFPPFAVTDEGWSDIAGVIVLPPAQSPVPPHPLRAQFGDQWLFGYALAETAAPGARVPVTLYWLRSAEADQTVTAFGETRSLAAWPSGQVVALDYELQAPASGASLPVSVATGRAARCGWQAPQRAACPLPPVRLAGQAAAEGARNFDNQLLLNAVVLETSTAAPGGQVRLSLEWQGLRRMSEDYTVFVHLLGPDGLVHGQVDAWPVSGTRATTTWEPGQPIHDAYTIQVPADAPPGDYQVEIGLYLLATGQRLPLLNETGAIVDDRVLLDGLDISN